MSFILGMIQPTIIFFFCINGKYLNFTAELLTLSYHTARRYHAKKSTLNKPTTTEFDVTTSFVENCMYEDIFLFLSYQLI